MKTSNPNDITLDVIKQSSFIKLSTSVVSTPVLFRKVDDLWRSLMVEKPITDASLKSLLNDLGTDHLKVTIEVS